MTRLGGSADVLLDRGPIFPLLLNAHLWAAKDTAARMCLAKLGVNSKNGKYPCLRRLAPGGSDRLR